MSCWLHLSRRGWACSRISIKLRANGRNIAGSCCVLLHVAKSLTGFKFCATTPNNSQQHATGCANLSGDGRLKKKKSVESKKYREGGWETEGGGKKYIYPYHLPSPQLFAFVNFHTKKSPGMVQMTMKSPQCTGTIKTRGKKSRQRSSAVSVSTNSWQLHLLPGVTTLFPVSFFIFATAGWLRKHQKTYHKDFFS